MIYLEKSNRVGKKWLIKLENGKKIHFGDNLYLDYTQHKDEQRKQNYINRHKPREDWNDMETAGFWAYHLLWNLPSINESIKDIEQRYRVKIVKKK